MLANGYSREYAERCFEQIKGFSEYGFPESHAASFAHLVYVSAWLKHHHPAAFAAALINSQPMGFYAPAQIIRDAQEHGVEVREVDVSRSRWDCTLEEGVGAKACRDEVKSSPPCRSSPALRLGMRLVKGLREEEAKRMTEAVDRRGCFETMADLRRASGVRLATLRALGRADAFGSMGLDRQHALWEIGKLRDEAMPLFDEQSKASSGRQEVEKRHEDSPVLEGATSCASLTLPVVPPSRQVSQDYRYLGLSLKAHPMSFIRQWLNQQRAARAADLRDEDRWPHGRRIGIAGIAICRQRPSTASGIVFITLEDETGISNLIIRPKVYERYRAAARHGVVLMVHGRVERKHDIVHIMAHCIATLDDRMGDLIARSRDFH
jgi:error-prone DNA polymerase